MHLSERRIAIYGKDRSLFDRKCLSLPDRNFEHCICEQSANHPKQGRNEPEQRGAIAGAADALDPMDALKTEHGPHPVNNNAGREPGVLCISPPQSFGITSSRCVP